MVLMATFVYQWFCDGGQEIRAYALTAKSETVCWRVSGFRPGFYVESIDSAKMLSVLRDLKSIRTKRRILNHLYSSRGSNVLFTWLDFECWFEAKKASDLLTKAQFKCHQTRAQPVLQLLSRADLPTCGWITTKEPPVCVKRDKYSKCKYEYVTDWKNLSECDRDDQPLITWVALDLEVNSELENAMPKDRPGDEIFMAGVIVVTPNRPPKRLLFSLTGQDYEDLEPEEAIEVRQYESEKALLLGLCKMLTALKPQMVCGYNVLGFDIDYMLQRCRRLGIEEALCSVGMAAHRPAKERVISWSSTAFGAQKYNYLDWEGLIPIDLLPIIRRDYKMDSYRLDFVAETLLGANKDPVTYKDIFKAYRTKKMAVVGKYCVKDSQLCVDLMENLQVWVGLTEMAKVCKVNIFTLFTQGQQIKIFSQVYCHCEKNGYVVTDPQDGKKTAWAAVLEEPADQDSSDYVGAHVVEPIPGLYENVVPLDFSSLYPSIMIAKNICYSTQADLNDPTAEIFEWEDHLNCPHDHRKQEYDRLSLELWDLEREAKELRRERDGISRKNAAGRQTVQDTLNAVLSAQKLLRTTRAAIKNSLGTKTVCATRRLAFYKSDTIKGVMPTILTNLLEGRARAKKAKTAAKDPITRITMDKRQLAYKVSANSMYGAMGVKRGYLPFQEGAMTVTYLGRQCIETAATLIGSEHGGTLVYGDTDSNYVTFDGIQNVRELWEKAEAVAKAVSAQFPRPITLEFEKVIYTKFLILGKKRYIYLSCDKNGFSTGQMGYRGVLMARRDNSGLARRAYRMVAQALLEKRDPWTDLNDLLSDMYSLKCPVKDYTITKQVGVWCREYNFVNQGRDSIVTIGDYKIRDLEKAKAQAKELTKDDEQSYMPVLYKLIMSQLPGHVQLANRMINRGETVADGTRLEYVVLKSPYNGKKGRWEDEGLSSRLETSDYYFANREFLKLDVEHYVKTLINPLDQLLETACKGEGGVKAVHAARVAYRKVVEDIKTLRAAPHLVKCV
ncbi:DNA polymerase [Singapore grouper iridovirus]|uniref:DNA-directed DNA polymerase n=1 Tax=Singapore grouper iridovirus TaxID=262968 RepID=Q5YFD7_9VIRU|nr:DNA polymerase [Singapore grouper iridovirus]AAS18143.1 DNA polymerase [Singapore grouper iridovirus]WAU86837.1 DNA polymerase [Singapore grouper iridovirus]